MGKVFDGIDARNADFIRAQHVFFVASAPLAGDGHINLSPKGLDGLAILDEHTVAYLDLMGSGIETVAHMRENGRIVLMFCAFDGPPRILRLHGTGEVVEPADTGWVDLAARFEQGGDRLARSIIRVRVDRVSDSCGYGVPRYAYEGERGQLFDWGDRKDDAALAGYRRDFNAKSLDGLPGLREGE